MTTGRINQVLQTLAVILGRVLGLVTRAHGDMAWALVLRSDVSEVRFLPGASAG